jgi:ribosome biogenesis GTPase
VNGQSVQARTTSDNLPLHRYGWSAELAAAFAEQIGAAQADAFAGQDGAARAAAELVPARLIRVDRGRAEAVVAHGEGTRHVQLDLYPILTRDPVETPCTGDWVGVDLTAKPVRGEAQHLDGSALLRMDRSTALVRSTSSVRSEGQVLAANVNLVLLAIGLDVPLDVGRLERLLAVAWESRARPVVVLTKADLAPDAELMREDAEATAPGVEVRVVSAATGAGIGELAELLAGGGAVLVGQSGAGKSTLTNALLEREVMTVQQTRQDGKGRHTTVTRELLLLPNGGVLIDTPGLRGIGMFDSAEGLNQVFAEIEALVAECRFGDCGHGSEPGCRVRDALESGELTQRRHDSWRKLQRENAWIASRTDARLRAEMVKPWKRMSKETRRQRKY